MGGSAMGAKRLNRQEFKAIGDLGLAALAKALPGAQGSILLQVGEKDSFGDVDVLFADEKDQAFADDKTWGELIPALEAILKPADSRWQQNSSCWSAGIKLADGAIAQLDFNRSRIKSHEMMAAYCAWNDLGSLIGAVAKAQGFSLGQNGLSAPVLLDNNEYAGDALISLDWDESIRFFGYEPKGWRAGMETFIQMREYAFSSAWSHEKIYALENRPNKSRVRDKKRPQYMAFLEFLKEKKRSGFVKPDLWPAMEDESAWAKLRKEKREEAKERFPAFKESEREVKSSLLEKKEALARVGGAAWEALGASGEMVGRALIELKAPFAGRQAFLDWVAKEPRADLEEKMKTALLAARAKKKAPKA